MSRNKIFVILSLAGVILYGCSQEMADIGTSSTESLASYSDKSSTSSVLPPGSGNGSGDSSQVQEPGVITAGEWDDLRNWEFWYQLMEEDTFGFACDYWQTYPLHNRYSLVVKDNSGRPVADLPVWLMSGSSVLWKARTDNTGTAECWANPFSESSGSRNINLSLVIDGKPVSRNVIPFDQGVNSIIYEGGQVSRTLDLVFVMDATGSMDDELEYLKTEVLDVIETVKSGNSQIKINMGAVFYRDEGDEYLTRVSQISTDIRSTVNFIRNQSASGGGDFPEAVHTALNDAVEQLNWSDQATARIMFMLLDAPPHYEPGIVGNIQEEIKKAAEKGIKIIPVSASGIDKGTEFLLRYMSILSNSTYVFITNDSGIGNDHLTPTVGQYDVEYLNDLMVRLINQFIE